jgi:hypothetical protein
VKRRGGEIWSAEGILFIATHYHGSFCDDLGYRDTNVDRIFKSWAVSFCF